MKRTIKGVTYIRDARFAPVRTYHKRWIKAVDTAIFIDCPFIDLGLKPRMIDILFDMGLIEYGGKCYVISEKGKKYLT